MRRIVPITVLLFTCLALTGCNFWRLHGDSVKNAPTHRLSAGGQRLSLPVDVPTAAAAFADALPALGYAVSIHEVDAARASLVGQAGGQRARINIRARESGCQAVVSIGPFADAHGAEQIIEAAKSRLGLR